MIEKSANQAANDLGSKAIGKTRSGSNQGRRRAVRANTCESSSWAQRYEQLTNARQHGCALSVANGAASFEGAPGA
jgi:hypothetical protein